MKKIAFIAVFASILLTACSSKPNQTKPIDYTSPCACYEVIKITGTKG